MKCARKKFKKKFMAITYEKHEMKWTRLYGAKWSFKLMLNKLKVTGVLLLFTPFWRPSSNKVPWKFTYVHYPNNHLENLPESQVNFHVMEKKMDSGEWTSSIKWK